MKYLFLILSFAFCLDSYAQNLGERMENEFIVKFKTESNQTENISEPFYNNDLRLLNAQVQVSKIQEIKSKTPTHTYVLNYSNSDYSIDEVIAMYKDSEYFEYVEPNFIGRGSGVVNTVPNDDRYFNQWGLKNDGTFSQSTAVSGADIDMELAWDIEQGDPNMIVAIIDSGVRLTHPEFDGRVWTNPNEVIDGTDTDGNGFVDDVVAGWDFINDDNHPVDDHGHGTNVAGIALATGDNNIGYAGINWNSRMMVCKSLNDNNSGSYSAMAGAIYYAVDNGAKVINMSIGGSSQSFTLSGAIDYCHANGVVLVACMMNFNNDVPYYPAAYPKTIAVGSTNPDDTRTAPFFWSLTSGSNYGPHIDVVAPGNYMYGLSYDSDTWYGSYWGGTSQSTPLVAGVISLLLAQNPSLTFDDIRTILAETAEDQVGDSSEDINGFDIYHGHGRMNAYGALTHQIVSVENIPGYADNVILYPNPLREGNNLSVTNLESGNYDVTVYNAAGQIIQNENNLPCKSSNLMVPTSDLNRGTYFIKITHKAEQKTLNRKLVIE